MAEETVLLLANPVEKLNLGLKAFPKASLQPQGFDIPIIDFIPKPLSAVKGIEALKALTPAQLQEMAGCEVDETSEAGQFLDNLRDAYIRMVTRISENNPEQTSYKEPKRYSEIEIYHSVLEIMEDYEIFETGWAFGEEDYPKDQLEIIASTIFHELNEVFCLATSWGNMRVPKDMPVKELEGDFGTLREFFGV